VVTSERLTVAEALAQAQLIEESLAAWHETAPEFVASVGGRDGLARLSEMTCIGPVPRLDDLSWQRAAMEYTDRFERGRRVRAASTPIPALAVVEPEEPLVAPAPVLPKRSFWGFWSR